MTHQVSIAQHIANLPRQIGYTPTGRVVVTIADRASGAVHVIGTSTGSTEQVAAAEAASLARAAASATAPVVALVIGWRGGVRDIKTQTTRLADALILAGIDVRERIVTDGRRYRLLGRGQGDQSLPSGLVGPLATEGVEPVPSREALAAMWRPSGRITPTPASTRDGVAAWRALLLGQASTAQVAQAAGIATEPVGTRDRIMAALTSFALTDEQMGEVATLTQFQGDAQMREHLSQAVATMAPGRPALPMLTMATACMFSLGLPDTGVLVENLHEAGMSTDDRLASLLCLTIISGLSPAGLKE